METLITILHVVVALFMVLVVLVQGGNSGGVGAAFGGGSSSGLFGASGANTFLTRLTYGAATVFMLTSIALTVMQGRAGKTGLTEKLQQANQVPSSAAAPAAEPVKAADPAAPAASSAPAAAPAASPAPDAK